MSDTIAVCEIPILKEFKICSFLRCYKFLPFSVMSVWNRLPADVVDQKTRLCSMAYGQPNFSSFALSFLAEHIVS